MKKKNVFFAFIIVILEILNKIYGNCCQVDIESNNIIRIC